jgi:hypothetical protein
MSNKKKTINQIIKSFFVFYIIIAEDEKLENNTKIYLCGTLWHETVSEMILMLKSIMR